jgi:hypothetical protein
VHCDRADAVLEEEEGVLDALHRGKRKDLGIFRERAGSNVAVDMTRDGVFVDVACVHACVLTVFVLYPLHDRRFEGTSEQWFMSRLVGQT